MASFSRWKCVSDASWPYRRFRGHHTQLNSFYWSHWAADHLTRRHARSEEPTVETAAHFGLSGNDDARRPPRTLAEWETTQREAGNWLRLNAALAMASYLELYLRQVSTLALLSDPSIMLGGNRLLDGIAVLKHSQQQPAIEPFVAGVTRGDWAARLVRYKGLFGPVPTELESHRADLHDLQTLRNRVGHEFGRDSHPGDLSWLGGILTPSERLSEDRLKKWLGVIEVVGRAIDRHLVSKHIGAFECLLLYHRERTREGRPISANELRKRAAQEAGGPVAGTEYFREVIAAYDRA